MRFMLVLLLLLPTLAAAQPNYLPLRDGNTWTYTAGPGNTWVATVQGTAEVRGVTTVRMVNEIVGLDEQQYENWWTVDAEGNVFLHGFINAGFSLEYEPPILYVDAPLSLAHSWAVSFQSISEKGTSDVDVVYTVDTDELLELPAGTLRSFGISVEVVEEARRSGIRFDALGRRLPSGVAKSGDTRDWFSDGVGFVQNLLNSRLYQLESFDLGSVALQASSWGAVKALYR